jgi:hypothetical protein
VGENYYEQHPNHGHRAGAVWIALETSFSVDNVRPDHEQAVCVSNISMHAAMRLCTTSALCSSRVFDHGCLSDCCSHISADSAASVAV